MQFNSFASWLGRKGGRGQLNRNEKKPKTLFVLTQSNVFGGQVHRLPGKAKRFTTTACILSENHEMMATGCFQISYREPNQHLKRIAIGIDWFRLSVDWSSNVARFRTVERLESIAKRWQDDGRRNGGRARRWNEQVGRSTDDRLIGKEFVSRIEDMQLHLLVQSIVRSDMALDEKRVGRFVGHLALFDAVGRPFIKGGQERKKRVS